ncbi:MAG TPA: hypothetical protein VLF61_04600 [Rhabdochlamydiaceae bacterium]|nr:hypothetical protein [Rhabdochlamydiaceae bacterium]
MSYAISINEIKESEAISLLGVERTKKPKNSRKCCISLLFAKHAPTSPLSTLERLTDPTLLIAQFVFNPQLSCVCQTFRAVNQTLSFKSNELALLSGKPEDSYLVMSDIVKLREDLYKLSRKLNLPRINLGNRANSYESCCALLQQMTTTPVFFPEFRDRCTTPRFFLIYGGLFLLLFSTLAMRPQSTDRDVLEAVFLLGKVAFTLGCAILCISKLSQACLKCRSKKLQASYLNKMQIAETLLQQRARQINSELPEFPNRERLTSAIPWFNQVYQNFPTIAFTRKKFTLVFPV